MASLSKVDQKFHIPFTVIEGGTGIVRGVLSETDQNAQPSFIFVRPRHVFRTAHPTALKPGMVIQSRSGEVYLVGDNGPSENRRGTLWDSFRLFRATGLYTWQRRQTVQDPITTLPESTDTPLDLGLIWAALEPMDREMMDREMRQSFEQRRVIAGAPIQSDDLIDNQPVTKVDTQLGLSIGVLT